MHKVLNKSLLNEWMKETCSVAVSAPASLLRKTEYVFYEGSESRFHIGTKAYIVHFICKQKGIDCVISFEKFAEG